MRSWYSYLLIFICLMLSMKISALKIPRLRRNAFRLASVGLSAVNPKVFSDANLRYSLKKEALSGLPDLSKPFTVLGIESSCDDTGVAIVKSDGTIVSNVVYSQFDIHKKFGGIVPSLAMEQHKLNINVAVDEALAQSGFKMEDIDAVAVTQGPGLEVCLRVGMRKAQAIATEYKKPFVTVHHLEAHCMMARLAGQNPQIGFIDTPKTEAASSPTHSALLHAKSSAGESTLPHFTPKVEFPFLVLLASGGHTSLLVCRELGDYTVLGGTLDDALGEAFDKAARLLGLQSATSGGVAIERAAAEYQSYLRSTGGEKSNCSTRTALEGVLDTKTGDGELRHSGLSVPMKDKTNCHFSYAGLKTQFRNSVEIARAAQGYSESDNAASNAPASTMSAVPDSLVTLPKNMTNKLCYDFQNTAFAHVEDRLKHALNYVDHERIPVTSLIVVGGVAANVELRRRLWALLRVRSSRLQATNAHSTTPLQDISLVFPPPKLCTDNGVMVAWTGIEKLSRGISNQIEDQDVIPRWPIGTPLTEKDDKVMGSLKKGGHKNRNERKADRVLEAAATKRLLDQIVVL